MRLLICDNDPVFVKYHYFELLKVFTEIHVALDSSSAWKYLELNPYDMVLVDLSLPELNGDGLVAFIRQDLQAPTKVVFLSDDADDLLRQRAMHIGVDLFLAKPIYRKEMMQKVRRLMSKRPLFFRFLLCKN